MLFKFPCIETNFNPPPLGYPWAINHLTEKLKGSICLTRSSTTTKLGDEFRLQSIMPFAQQPTHATQEKCLGITTFAEIADWDIPAPWDSNSSSEEALSSNDPTSQHPPWHFNDLEDKTTQPKVTAENTKINVDTN